MLLSATVAYANEGGPFYQRNRHHGHPSPHHRGKFRHQPYYGGYYYPPTFYGSWYARPYPYHFDYYRWRYSMPPLPPVDCPCADATP